MKAKKILVVTAAGSGVRMGAALPKQFLSLGGKPVLRRSIEAFVKACPDIRVITVLPKEHIPYWKDYCRSGEFYCPQTIVAGGITRFHSVRNALARVPDGSVVAIHDGVRPLLSEELISGMFEKMESGRIRALIPVVPMVDTLKVLDRGSDDLGNEVLVESAGEKLDRSRIFGAQTPQIFRAEDLKSAYSQPYDTAFTDDASVVQAKGIPLSFCEGERHNFKLTTPEDMLLAEMIVSARDKSGD
ncbi:MAG: 2-C-methyl-D-erythritol 4-phosphate cytidylyltransferase [Candidatus Cryptobacteroides sp.]